MPKHRKVQITVSSGIVFTAICALFFPSLEHVAVLVGTAANMVWLWE